MKDGCHIVIKMYPLWNWYGIIFELPLLITFLKFILSINSYQTAFHSYFKVIIQYAIDMLSSLSYDSWFLRQVRISIHVLPSLDWLTRRARIRLLYKGKCRHFWHKNDKRKICETMPSICIGTVSIFIHMFFRLSSNRFIFMHFPFFISRLIFLFYIL